MKAFLTELEDNGLIPKVKEGEEQNTEAEDIPEPDAPAVNPSAQDADVTGGKKQVRNTEAYLKGVAEAHSLMALLEASLARAVDAGQGDTSDEFLSLKDVYEAIQIGLPILKSIAEGKDKPE